MVYLLHKHLHSHQPQQLHAAGCAAWQALLQGLDSAHAAVFSTSSSCTQAEAASGARREQDTCSSTSCLQLNPHQRQSCRIPRQRLQLEQHQQHSTPVEMLNRCRQPQQQQQQSLRLTWQGKARVLQASSSAIALQPPSCNLTPLQNTLFPTQQPYLLQQQQYYHRSQHRARLLTTQLKQKSCWQDLQQAFDARNSGEALNAIHLTTMLLQLTRVAPRAELVPSNERQQMQQFTQELVAACHKKLHRMDHRGLSSYIQSLTTLRYNIHQLPLPPAAPAAAEGGQQQQLEAHCSSSSSSSSSSTMFSDILQAAVRQIAQADAQSCAAVASGLATLLQQQQQQDQEMLQAPMHQEQQQLLRTIVSALLQRIYGMAVKGQMTADKACQVCFAAARLAAAVRARVATSAAGAAMSAATGATSAYGGVMAAAGGGTSAVPDAMSAVPAVADATSAADFADLAANLRSLVLLTAQQVAAAVTAATTTDTLLWREPLVAPQDAGLLLSSLAKSRAWPGWDTLLLLLQQYSWGVAAALIRSASPYTGSTAAYSSNRNKVNKRRGFAAAIDDSSSAAAAAAAAAESAADQILRTLPPMIWALGRLLEQDRQHLQHRRNWLDHKRQQQQLQCYIDLWQTLDSCILAGSRMITAASPAQLAQLIAGLNKVVTASGHVVMRTTARIQADLQWQQKQQKLAVGGSGVLEPVILTQQAVAAAAAPQGNVADPSSDSKLLVTDGQQVSVAHDLEQLLGKLKHHLESTSLQELLRLHVAATERMLPLMPVDARLQIADCYRQFGVQLPQAVSVVFGRDAAQPVAKQTQLWHI